MKKHVSKLVSMALAAAMVIGGMPTTAALAAWDDIDADRKYTAQFDNLQDLADRSGELRSVKERGRNPAPSGVGEERNRPWYGCGYPFHRRRLRRSVTALPQ